MSYLDWKAGDRVVCVAPTEGIARMKALVPEATLPEPNTVYTIRELRDDSDLKHKPGTAIALLLVEIDNEHMIGTRRDGWKCYREPGFPPSGFRKVQPRKTSIASLEAILHGARVPEDA